MRSRWFAQRKPEMNLFNPEMLGLARESRELTQKALADLSGVDQGNISKYERGILDISDPAGEKLARALHYPVHFFHQVDEVRGIGSGCFYHRKRQTMPVTELRVIQAKANILRMQAAKLLQRVEIEHDNRIARLDINDGETAEGIARLVRATWELPLGPIKNLVGAFERAGGIVYRCSFGTKKLDAISQWCRNMPPLIFVNSEVPGDRLRWSMAHELGHVIMHRIPSENSEREADQFASEFLLPAREIIADLNYFNLQRAATLKVYWRVSMAALIMRAHSLEKITDSQKTSLFKQLSAANYRTKEPDTVPIEKPTLLTDIIDTYINKMDYSVGDLAHLLALEEDEFRYIYMGENSDRNGLRVVG